MQGAGADRKRATVPVRVQEPNFRRVDAYQA